VLVGGFVFDNGEEDFRVKFSRNAAASLVVLAVLVIGMADSAYAATGHAVRPDGMARTSGFSLNWD
jgi:hypothetical protein